MDRRLIQAKTAITEVLGGICLDPSLLDNHPLQESDFPEPFHRLFFKAVSEMYRAGYTALDGYSVDSYIKEHFESEASVFKRNNGVLYVETAMKLAENFEPNYTELKKYSVLRKLNDHGIDITDIFDPDETCSDEIEKKRALFDRMSPDDIVSYFQSKLDTIKIGIPSKIQFNPVLSLPGADQKREFIVEGFLGTGTLNNIVGEKKAGKSFMAHQLCFCVQNGIPFLGMKTIKKDVLLIDYEMDPFDLADRFEGLKKFFNMPKAKEYKALCLSDRPEIKLDNVVAAIEEEKRSNQNLGMVVLDCYYRFAEGDDENSARDTEKTLAKLVAIKAGIAVVYIHHTSKSNNRYDALDSGAGSNVHGRIVSECLYIRKESKSSQKLKVDIAGRYFNDEFAVSRSFGPFFQREGLEFSEAAPQGGQKMRKTRIVKFERSRILSVTGRILKP